MSLEDSIRWSEHWPTSRFAWYETDYQTQQRPDGDPKLLKRWADLWYAENPPPRREDAPGMDEIKFQKIWKRWYAEKRRMDDRIWVAYCFPQFRVFDWSDKDVALARKLVSRHICGVCGRSDDPGCYIGC